MIADAPKILTTAAKDMAGFRLGMAGPRDLLGSYRQYRKELRKRFVVRVHAAHPADSDKWEGVKISPAEALNHSSLRLHMNISDSILEVMSRYPMGFESQVGPVDLVMPGKFAIRLGAIREPVRINGMSMGLFLPIRIQGIDWLLLDVVPTEEAVADTCSAPIFTEEIAWAFFFLGTLCVLVSSFGMGFWKRIFTKRGFISI